MNIKIGDKIDNENFVYSFTYNYIRVINNKGEISIVDSISDKKIRVSKDEMLHYGSISKDLNRHPDLINEYITTINREYASR